MVRKIKTRRISILVPAQLLQEIEELIKETGETLEEFVISATKKHAMSTDEHSEFVGNHTVKSSY